ncbi:TraR/DksA C4-type zinc finger protein [Leclercia adecarboxylata]
MRRRVAGGSPEARRKAYPGCTMCVDCHGEQELRNKQRAG